MNTTDQKKIAKDFLVLVGTGKVEEGYQHVANDFIHHNQYFKGDRASLKLAMTEAHKEDPNEAIEVKNIYQDGDSVITHSLIKKKDMEIAVVHIFRFREDEIIELWDLGQKIEEDGPNENGLF